MWSKASGQPFVGNLSLNTGAPGPLAIPIYTVPGGPAYTLDPAERIVITNISVSSNDTASPLVTLDDGSPAVRVVAKYYAGSTLPASNEAIVPGVLQGYKATNFRATSTAITAAKTVEVVIRGYVTRTV